MVRCLSFDTSLGISADVCTESGLLVFNILEGEFAQSGSHLEIIMDDMLFASYTSAKTRERTCKFNESKSGW